MQGCDGEAPGDIGRLGRPERLLVWTLRAIAVGHGDCPRLRQAFEAACGPQGGHALMAYFALVRMIGFAGRRQLRLHVPGCVSLSSDERAMLAVIAAAQDGLGTGDTARLKAHLRWLVEGEPDQSFIHASNVVAHILQANGQHLPLRTHCVGPEDRRAAAPATSVPVLGAIRFPTAPDKALAKAAPNVE